MRLAIEASKTKKNPVLAAGRSQAAGGRKQSEKRCPCDDNVRHCDFPSNCVMQSWHNEHDRLCAPAVRQHFRRALSAKIVQLESDSSTAYRVHMLARGSDSGARWRWLRAPPPPPRRGRLLEGARPSHVRGSLSCPAVKSKARPGSPFDPRRDARDAVIAGPSFRGWARRPARPVAKLFPASPRVTRVLSANAIDLLLDNSGL